MTGGNDKQSSVDLEARLWRIWLAASVFWVLATCIYALANWTEIYPHRPAYLIAPNKEQEKLVVWYADDGAPTVDQFTHERGFVDAQFVAVGRNTLLLPGNLGEAQKRNFIERAGKMEVYLNERFYRGVLFRFVPLLLLCIFGLPLVILLLGRSMRGILLCWLAG